MFYSKIAKGLMLSASVSSMVACSWLADTTLNGLVELPPYTTSDAVASVHKQLTLVDLHADPLLWNRDLLHWSSRGHVDVPRLLKGNTTLEVFGVVTAIPFPPKITNNPDTKDVIGLLAKSQNWPPATYKSRLQRALYQGEKLQRFVNASAKQLTFVRTRADLDFLLSQRKAGVATVGGLLSLEGAHALEGKVENIETLFGVGFRMLGLTHYTDNAMAGSAHGVKRYGLTDKGRELVKRAAELGMVLDLSHASAATIDDVIELVDKPVIASHGGVRGTCDTARNLSDEQLRAIAKTGGVIGIGIYHYATCGYTVNHTVQAIQYAYKVVGIDHIALGSDFDGSVTTLFDASGWPRLTEALMNAGFSVSEIEAIMGGNALRVLRQILPNE